MIKLFLDTANIEDIKKYNDSLISGLTTNPSLAKKAGIKNYNKFIDSVLSVSQNKPVSFEVLSKNIDEMALQANFIAEFDDNILVKFPIKNTDGLYYLDNHYANKKLYENISINITAITTLEQVKYAIGFLSCIPKGRHIISIFAGRIADCGFDPELTIEKAKQIIIDNGITNMQVLWASSREVFNIYQADRSGADIITCTPEILNKFIKLRNKNLEDYATEISIMFYNDSQEAGLELCLTE